MKYQKILGPIFLVAFGLVYLHFAHNGYALAHPKPRVLGVATSSDPSVLADQISAEFQNLQDQNAALQTSLDKANFLLVFPRNLKRGMAGADVTALQTDLNQLSDLGIQIIVSGHFTKTTESALKIFQESQGLKATGIFDQATKEKLAESILTPAEPDQTDISTSLQALIDSQQSAADANTPTTTSTDASLASSTDSSLLPSDASSGGVCPAGCISQSQIPDCAAPTQDTSVPPDTSLPPDTTTPLPAPSATTTPATSTSLSISNVLSSGISASGTNISWSTNINADGQADYGKTTGYGQSTSLNTALTTSHAAVLSGLTASTQYHFRVKSKDASGNLVTSTDQTFTTLAPPDIIPPKISNIQTSKITASGATITWITDKNSDSELVYGKTSGYGQSAPINASLVTSHSVTLSGLLASTQYHFQVKSKDAAGNLATSADQTFTTAK